MTEHLIYIIYKLTNNRDDMIYIGSTRLILRVRMECHRSEAKKGNKKPLSEHMRTVGSSNFKIELIKEITVSSSKEAHVEEQKEIEKYPEEKILNVLQSYSSHNDKRLNIEKRRASRRAYYYRKKQDSVWLEKEKLRNKLRMRIKRHGTAAETERPCAQA